jgi:pantothenate kinase
VDVLPQIAKRRLIERHVHAGIETSREAAAMRVEDNDLQNGAMIRSKLILPDVIIMN